MVPGAENKTGNYEAYIALELVSTRVHSDSKKGFKSQLSRSYGRNN